MVLVIGSVEWYLGFNETNEGDFWMGLNSRAETNTSSMAVTRFLKVPGLPDSPIFRFDSRPFWLCNKLHLN